MERPSGEDRKKLGTRSEFVQSLSLNKKDPKDLLENILGKEVQIKDFLKISTKAATSNLSQSKSVRFSFAKDDPESASQKLSLKARDSNKPIKSALLIKNPKFPQPKILTEEERRSHVDNFDHEFLDKHIRGLVIKEASTRNKLKLQLRKSPDLKASGSKLQAEKGITTSPSKDKFLRSLTENKKDRECSEDHFPDLRENTQTMTELNNSIPPHPAQRRRYSVEQLEKSSKNYRSSLLLETDLDKHCFSDPEEDVVRVNPKLGSKRDPNTPGLGLKINKQLTKLNTNSDSSTNCGGTQLRMAGSNTPGAKPHDQPGTSLSLVQVSKDGDFSTAENSRAEQLKATPNFGPGANHGFKKLSLQVDDPPIEAINYNHKPDNFTIKEEPSCAEELLTPNASARFESISNAEDDNSKQMHSSSGALANDQTNVIRVRKSANNRFNTFDKIVQDTGLSRNNTLEPRHRVAPRDGVLQGGESLPPPVLTLTYHGQEPILEEDYSRVPEESSIARPPKQLETIKESESDDKKSHFEASHKSLRGFDGTSDASHAPKQVQILTEEKKQAKPTNQCCNLI